MPLPLQTSLYSPENLNPLPQQPRLCCEYAVGLRSAIAEELPHPPDFSDHVEIEIGDHHFVFVPACLGNDFPARIAEVAFAIKFTDVPGLLFANPIDRADKIAIRHRMRGLLQLPEILRQSRYRRRRVEHDLRRVQAQNACPFGKMPVVTDVNANAGILRFKDRITQIARGKVELFPEARMAVRDVVLSVFSKIAAIGVDHRRSVEI